MADVQLATGGNSTLGQGQIVRRGPWISAKGFLYSMITNPAGVSGAAIPNKSTDNGVTWTAEPTGTSALFGDASVVNVTFSREIYQNRIYAIFHTKVGGAAADNRIRVGYYTMDTDTWTALPSQPAITPPVVMGSPVSPIEPIDIVLDSAGNITLVFTWGYNTPQNSYRLQYADFIAGVWGAQTEIPGQNAFPNPNGGGAAQQFDVSQILRASTGRLFLFAYDDGGVKSGGAPASGQVNGYAITRESIGGAWNTLQQIVTDIPWSEPRGSWPFGLGAARPAGGGVVVPYLSGTFDTGTSHILGMVLYALHAPDQPNPAFTRLVVDANISNGNPNNVPAYAFFDDVPYSVVIDGSLTVMYWFSATSIQVGGGGNGQPNAGDLRRSYFQSGAWTPFFTYRSFSGISKLVPAGVYAFNRENALYLRLTNAASQGNIFHFLAAVALPAPAQIAFHGVRRLPRSGPPVDRSTFEERTFTYQMQGELGFGDGQALTLRQTITDFDFELYQVEFSYSAAGPLPKVVCTVLLYDQAHNRISNIPFLDSFLNGLPGSPYENGGLVPPLLYKQNTQVRVDLFNLTAVTPITATVILVGKQRIPKAQ